MEIYLYTSLDSLIISLFQEQKLFLFVLIEIEFEVQRWKKARNSWRLSEK